MVDFAFRRPTGPKVSPKVEYTSKIDTAENPFMRGRARLVVHGYSTHNEFENDIKSHEGHYRVEEKGGIYHVTKKEPGKELEDGEQHSRLLGGRVLPGQVHYIKDISNWIERVYDRKK